MAQAKQLPPEARLVKEDENETKIARDAGVDPRTLSLPDLLKWLGATEE